MTTETNLQLGLEDLLADLHHARRHLELGRLALLCYCEVRSWARQAGEPGIGERSTQMFTQNPSVCKEEFLRLVDRLIADLEDLQPRYTVRLPVSLFSHTERFSPISTH